MLDKLAIVAKSGDGAEIALNPVYIGQKGYEAMLLIATTHEDPFVRMEAAEKLIRIAIENPLKGYRLNMFKQPDDDSEAVLSCP